MPEPMLVVEDHDVLGKTRAIPNLLPCRVHHTGPVDPVSEYWDPTQSEDSTSVAYFRGRKLKGRTVALPDNFKGVVVERRPREKGGKQSDIQEHDGESADAVETEALQVTARFEQVLVWSHGASIDPATDPCVRGFDEWLQVAAKVRTLQAETKQ
ncbi:ribonuclease H1/H2 small subunit [Ophiocordyceps sinensis CO18]|uniref:Ribonuclease H1/H2 small subunit n=1 Tax=Ophiocordyceps sinensis (strain Co18 / CGMCC 3.14243) TaxID=911162 RepID=T5AQ44_OPHSC|nr:ribonuclease H1/H2 small subunit [Ophiocordyceps sinensis CO18]